MRTGAGNSMAPRKKKTDRERVELEVDTELRQRMTKQRERLRKTEAGYVRDAIIAQLERDEANSRSANPPPS